MICPIKTDKNWIELVKVVGETKAYQVFVANNNVTPDFNSSPLADTIATIESQFDRKTAILTVADKIIGQTKTRSLDGNKIYYQLPEGRQQKEYVASEKTIRDLAARMSDRIGIPVRFETDINDKYKGKLEHGEAVINLAYATLDTPIHEILGHPIIRAIKNRKHFDGSIDRYNDAIVEFEDKNPNATREEAVAYADRKVGNNQTDLYQNLLKELETGKGKEVLDRIKKDYVVKDTFEEDYKSTTHSLYRNSFLKRGYKIITEKEFKDKVGDAPLRRNRVSNIDRVYLKRDKGEIKYDLQELQEEAIVELLGLYTAHKLDNIKDGKLVSLLKKLLKEIKSFMKSLLKQREVEIDKLPDNMTLGDLSDLLAYSNSKLILPGNEVVYTTPDNKKFKTYQEASNHISKLIKQISDVDLDSIIKEFPKRLQRLKEVEEQIKDEGIMPNSPLYIKLMQEVSSTKLLLDFINKNKEYEQSKEIIEEWKKVNNIQYNPEEVYSRGQEFVSVVGAYSDFDVNLMMQNLLQHIEDNQKAGGEFTISAFTKPIDKQIGHLEGGGGKIKFKIYPQSQDIKWAANTDIYSGSVWDASEKINKDKKSELLGVSYTKYPSLNRINAVQPNLAGIIDNLAHHHNELGITLTGSNFRLEYDGDIPYSTKKIIDSINSILDQKYGKLVKPDTSLRNVKEETTYDLVLLDNDGYPKATVKRGFKSLEEAKQFGEQNKDKYIKWSGSYKYEKNTKIILGIQPTQTNETLKESVENVKSKTIGFGLGLTEIRKDNTGKIIEARVKAENKESMDSRLSFQDNKYYLEPYNQSKFGNPDTTLEISKEEYDAIINKENKDFTSQALINTKIAKLKEVAKKYPRSLIRNEVTPIGSTYGSQFSNVDVLFQKVSETTTDSKKDLNNSALYRLVTPTKQNENQLGLNDPSTQIENTVNKTVTAITNSIKSPIQKAEIAKQKKFIQDRFPDSPIDIYETMLNVGSHVAHGYFKNMAFHLWQNAEKGTAYHEAFHGMTQMMLNDNQLNDLYSEASEFYGIDRSSELAIEEQLAESFREYMFTMEDATLPQKIAQFFKGLLYYIKSLMTDSMSIDQAFSMLEQNRLPRPLKRDVSRFKGESLYSMRPGYTFLEYKDIIDGIYSQFNNIKNTRLDLTSFSAQLDATRDWFLTNAFVKIDGTPLDTAIAKKALLLEQEYYAILDTKNEQLIEQKEEELGNFLYEQGIDLILNEKVANVPSFLDDTYKSYIRMFFQDIYLNWEAGPNRKKAYFGNFETSFWKDLFIDSLPEFGYQVEGDYTIIRSDENTEDLSSEAAELVGTTEVHERIYDRSHLEESMKDKLSGEVKTILSNIESKEVGLLGLNKRYRFNDVYSDVLEVFTQAKSWTDALAKLEEASRHKPHLAQVKEAFLKKDDRIKALAWSQLYLHTQEFMLLKSKKYGKKNIVQLINSNQNNKRKVLLNQWISNLKARKGENINRPHLLREQRTEEGLVYEVNPLVVDIIKENYAIVSDFLNSRDTELNTNVISAFANIMTSIGFFTKGKPVNAWISAHLDAGIFIKNSDVPLMGKSALRYLFNPKERNTYGLTQFLTEAFVIKNGKIVEVKTNLKDFTNEYQKALSNLVDIEANFTTDRIGSFIGADNKTKYPTNLRTSLADTISSIKNGLFNINDWLADKYMNPFDGNLDYTMLYYNYFLTKNAPHVDQLDTVTIDAVKTDKGNPTEYKNFSEINAYVTRFNMFFNRQNENYTYIALPVQADRGRIDFIYVPRTNAAKNRNELKSLIRRSYIQELSKIHQSENFVKYNPESDYLEGYHTGAKKGFKISGIFADITDVVNNKEFYLSPADLKGYRLNEKISTDKVNAVLTKLVEKFDGFINTNVENLVDYLHTKNIVSNEIVNGEVEYRNQYGKKSTFENAASLLDVNGKNGYVNIQDFARDYFLENLFHKDQMIKLFRISDDFSKNYPDFIKRFGAVNTPGLKLLIKGALSSDYGMLPTMNEMVIRDMKPLTNELYEALEGLPFAESYSKERINKSDAQGMMSLTAYRGYMQGLGKWDMLKDELAYNNYFANPLTNLLAGYFRARLADGSLYVPKIKPIKPYQEFNALHGTTVKTLVPHFIKNSYIVLTKEMTEGRPHLDALRRRMDKQGEYNNPNLPDIHLVNTESTRKQAKSGIHTLTDAAGDLSNVSFNVLDSNSFRIPQIKPDSEGASPSILFGSQLMRNIMSINDALIKDRIYNVNGTNLTRQELFDNYHNVIDEKIKRSTKKLFDELGYNQFKSNPTVENKKNFLINLRKELLNSAATGSRPLTDNEKKALDIEIIDSTLDFKVPLSFPAFAKKYEQLINGLIRKRIINQKMPGKQAVQAAEIGAFVLQDGQVARELRFLTKKDNKVQVAEIAVSADIAKQFNIKPGDAPSEALVNTLIGYRIPTQGKNSMMVFKIVEVLPENYESTVVVPGAITVQMGSDFDIDSLFLIFPHVDKVGAKIEYNPKQKIQELSDQQLDNGLFEIISSVLTHPDHYNEIMTPLDGADLSNLVKKYETEVGAIPRNSWNTEVEMQLTNRDGSSGIGIYANILMGHITGQYLDINTVSIDVIKSDGTSLVLNKISPIKDREGSLIEYNISQHMNAALENAKTSLMRALNDNGFTSYATGAMLTTGLTLEDAFLLRNHPAVVRMNELYEARGYYPVMVELAAKETLSEILKIPIEEIQFNSRIQLNIPLLKKDFKTQNLSNSEQVLSTFVNLFQLGRKIVDMNKMITPNRISDMSDSSAILEYLDIIEKVNSEKDIVINNRDGFPLNESYMGVIKEAIAFNKEFFPYLSDVFQNIKSDIKNLIGARILKKDIHNKINQALYLAMFSEVDAYASTVFNREYIKDLLLNPDTNIATLFNNIATKYPELSSNMFFEGLSVKSDNEVDGFQGLHFLNNYGTDVAVVNAQIDGFLQLYFNENAEIKDFANKLVDYTLMSTGFASSAHSLMKVIPVEVWNDKGLVVDYKNIHRKIMSNDYMFYSNLIPDIIAHHIQTPGFLKTLNIQTVAKYKQKDSDIFAIPAFVAEKILNFDKTNLTYFRIYNNQTQLFDAYGFHATEIRVTGDSSTKFLLYKKVQPKGETYKSIQYNINSSLGIKEAITPFSESTLSTESVSFDVSSPVTNTPFEAKSSTSSVANLIKSLDAATKKAFEALSKNEQAQVITTYNFLFDGALQIGILDSSKASKLKILNQAIQKVIGDKLKQKQSSIVFTESKIEHLQKAFKKIGLDVEVKINDSIEGFGEVSFINGKPVITLKSETLRAGDTEYHEFAHVYVELLRQSNPKLIEEGLAQIRDTELFSEIQSLYPELSLERLEIEVLTTAIGREAAFLSNSPKWKIWLNKLWYALKNLFNLKSNNVAKDLAIDLFKGELKTNNSNLNYLGLTLQQKQEAKKTSKLIEDLLLDLDKQVRYIKQQVNNEQSVTAKDNLKRRLKRYQDELVPKIAETKALIEFIDDSYNDSLKVIEVVERLSETPHDQRKHMLQEIGSIAQYLTKSSLLPKLVANLKQVELGDFTAKEITELNFKEADLSVYTDKLNKAISAYEITKVKLFTEAIPAMADALLEHVNPEVEASIQKDIDHILAGNEAPLILQKHVKGTTAYKELKKQRENKIANGDNIELINKDFDRDVRNLQINLLKAKLPTRKNIINTLREGITEQALISYMLDPLIYSHDQTLQLFSLLVKESFEGSRQETLADRISINEALDKLEKALNKKANNTADFYNPITEKILVNKKQADGTYKEMEVLALTQEYDIARYNKEKSTHFKELRKKYNVPESVYDMQAWAADNVEDYKNYNKDKATWYKKHTEGTDTWRKEYQEIRDKLATLRSQAKILEDTITTDYMFGTDGKETIADKENRLTLVENEIEALNNFLEDRISETTDGVFPKGEWSRPKKTMYKNAKYEALQNNKPYLEYYIAMRDYYFNKQDEIGNGYYYNRNAWETHTYILPSVRKNDVDRIIEQGLISYTKDQFEQLKGVMETSSESIDYATLESDVKTLPVYYNNLVDANDVSTDVSLSMLAMGQKANEFKAKSKILGHINTMDFLLRTRQPVKLDHLGRELLDSVGHNNQVLKKDESGVTSEYKHFLEFTNHVIYGKTSEKQIILGVEMNKLMGQFNKFAAFNVFPFNFLQGTANVLHGNILISEEAASNRFFGFKDYREAKKEYFRLLPGIVSDLGKNIPESHLGQLIEYFDAQEGKTMENLLSNVFGSRIKNLATPDQLMFAQRSGELQMAVTPLIAMLKREKAKDFKGNVILKDGKEMTLFDAFYMKDGKLILDSKVKFDFKDRVRMMNKLHGLNRSLQGIYDKFNRSALSKTWYGKGFLLFRSWMLANFRRNWGYSGQGLRVDHEMGVTNSGIYQTFFSFLKNSVWGVDGFQLSNPITRLGKLSQSDMNNMKKATVRITAYITAMLLYSALRPGEDEENQWYTNFAMYQARRLQLELVFWLNLNQAQNLLRSPMANQLIIDKGRKVLNQAITDPFGEYERNVGWKQKGDSKLYWNLVDLFPILHNLNKAVNADEAARAFGYSK
jgi:hypothetical protein